MDWSKQQLLFNAEVGVWRTLDGLQFRRGTDAGPYSPGQVKVEKDNEEEVSYHEPEAVGTTKPSELGHYQCI